MARLRSHAALLLALLAVPPAGPAEAASPQRGRQRPAVHPFAGDLDQARGISRERNLPIVVVVIQEGEEANERFRDGIFRHERFARACAGTLVILVNDGKHPEKTIEVQGPKGEKIERTVCSIFGTPTCADHKRNWTRVYQEFNQSGQMKTPHTIAILPDGKIHGRLIDVPGLSQVVGLIEGAARTAGPSLSAEQVLELGRLFDTATTMAKARLWPPAYRAWAAVLEITEAPIYAEDARRGVEAALGGMRGERDHSLGMMREGRVADGYAKLVEIAEAARGTPLEKELKKSVQQAERNREWKDAIKAHKRRLEADALWQKVLESLDGGRVKQAERLARQILRRFRGTPAFDEARKRFPELVEG